MKSLNSTTIVMAIGFVFLDVLLWHQILFAAAPNAPELFFLDVGQGDATLITLPGNITILTDAGPDRSIIKSLEAAFPASRRMIDIAIITHPQLDHYNGFNEILRRYRVGAFLVNGRMADEGDTAWNTLLATIKEKSIPLVVIGEGDRIRYGEHNIEFLAPGPDFLESGELNDTGLVTLARLGPFRALLTADIDTVVEEYLVNRFDLRAEVLKIAHHGSKYSSGEAFLREVDPLIAGIEVGKSNRYGHPTPDALERLKTFTRARVFRTDQDGTVRITSEGNTLKVFILQSK